MNNEKKAPVLTLENLAPYLPYVIRAIVGETERNITAVSVDSPFVFVSAWKGSREKEMVSIEDIKPILRPLSDLIKVIEHDGRKFIPMHQLKNGGTDLNEFRFLEWKGYSAIDNEEHETCYDPETMSFYQFYRGDSRMCTKQYEKMQLLFKWHFDVFGLIEKGLAIDYNKLKGGPNEI